MSEAARKETLPATGSWPGEDRPWQLPKIALGSARRVPHSGSRFLGATGAMRAQTGAPPGPAPSLCILVGSCCCF